MKNYLENKYKENFTVEESKIYDNGEKGTYHLAIAYPEKNHEQQFTVKWSEDDIGTFNDDYLNYKWNKEGNKIIKKKLKEVYKEDINFYFNFKVPPGEYDEKMDISTMIKTYPDDVTLEFTYYVFCKNNIDKEKEAKKIYNVIDNMFLDNDISEYSLTVYYINEKDRDNYEENKKYNLDLETSKLYKEGILINYLYMWDSNNVKNIKDIEELFKY